MSIPPRFLEQLRGRLTLSEIIGRRIKVTRAGREHKACCPFHKEKTPSFTINDDKQFYHCFGCGAHGDIVKFVMEYDNISFRDAVEQLASQAGMEVPQQSAQEIQQQKQQKGLYELMEEATLWFENQLYEGTNQDILRYVQGRGLSPETIKAFRLGFAPPDSQSLRQFLLKQGYTDQQMIEAALIKKKEGRAEPYVFFRERVMVPVTDRRGRVIAFGGRTLPDHLMQPSMSDFTPAKYMNSAETPVFNKSDTLYGEPEARRAAADGHTVLVTEGYFDVIACHQAGFRGAVAPMGTALTEEQIVKLWQMIPADMKEPVLCFDGDKAGRRAADRAAQHILPMLSAGKTARFAFLPEGEDPDSLIKAGGRKAFQATIENALPFVEYIWQSHTAGRDIETPEARAALIQSLDGLVQKIADRQVQQQYDAVLRQKISNFFYKRNNNGRGRSGAGGGARNAYRGGAQNKTQGYSLRVNRPAGRTDSVVQRLLIATVLNHPSIFEVVEEHFAELPIHDPAMKKICELVISYLNEDPDLDSEGLCRQISTRGFEREMKVILSPSTYMHGQFSAPSDLDPAFIQEKWLKVWAMSKQKDLDKEVKEGWANAFRNSNEDDENKIRSLIRQKKDAAQE